MEPAASSSANDSTRPTPCKRRNPAQQEDIGESKRRVAIACEACRQRRTRCDGKRPCDVCTRNDADCVYQSTNRRVWISQEDYLRLLDERDELRRRCQIPNRCMSSTSGDDNVATSTTYHSQRPAASTLRSSGSHYLPDPQDEGRTRSVSDDDGAEATGRLLVDDHGVVRYMGDSSGAAFYSALMEVLPLVLPQGPTVVGPHPTTSYHTWDSHPLPSSFANPFVLPPIHLANHLISIFFQHCSDVFHFLAPDDFRQQVHAMYAHVDGGAADTFEPSTQNEVWRLGQFYLALALGALHVHSPGDMNEGGVSPAELGGLGQPSSTIPRFPGMEYFARSKLFLPGLSEHSSLDAIKVLALTAYYLLSVSHRDGAYAYIGAAMRTCVTLGLHRMSRAVPQGAEHGQLVFWTVYVLDRLISSTLGRPVQVADTDITTPRPDNPSPELRASGLGAHVQIGILQGAILQDLYVPSTANPTKRLFALSAAVRHSAAARALAQDIDNGVYALAFSNPRAEVILKLTCKQVTNVVCRHAMLHALRLRLKEYKNWRESHQGGEFDWLFTGTPHTASTQGELEGALARLCSDAVQAAFGSAHLIGVLHLTGTTLPWCFFDNHCAYNAGIVLLLSKLVDPDGSLPHRGPNRTSSVDSDNVDTEVRTILDMFAIHASKGNESAQSCKAILDTLALAISDSQRHPPMPLAFDYSPEALAQLGTIDDPETLGEWADILMPLGMTL